MLASSRLWREVVDEVAPSYPEVSVEHALVDSTALPDPDPAGHYDVIVTENLFGDILSDEAAAIAGSLGLLASASLGTRVTEKGRFGLYEPVHGSAPGIAGQGVANPLATVSSAALMLLRWSSARPTRPTRSTRPWTAAIEDGPRTGDLGGSDGTRRSPGSCWRGSTSEWRCRRDSAPIVLYDTTLRDGTQREGLVLSLADKLQDRAPPRRGRLPVHRGRLAGLEPEGRGVLRGRAQHDLPARQAGRLRLDAPSRQPARRRTRTCAR